MHNPAALRWIPWIPAAGLALWVTWLLPLPAHADIVILHDGTSVEGEVISDDGKEVVIQGRFGKTTVSRAEIREIQKRKSPRTEYVERRDALAKSDRAADARAWEELAAFAQNNGLKDEATRAFEQALQRDPESAAANIGMGHVRHLGRWISSEEKRRLDAAVAGKPDPGAPAPGLTQAEISQVTGIKNFSDPGEQPIACPKCNGSGILIMLECLNCNKSPKVGYKSNGEQYFPCDRCKTTGKVVGMYCHFCQQTGKVYASRIRPSDGGALKAPGGYAWCPTCQGSKVEEWLPCNQCKRSKYPGYLFFGDRLEVCNKCSGTTKVPALACQTCSGKGIVVEKK